MITSKLPYKIEEGDEFEVDGTIYVVIDGEIVEKDERSPIEIRLDELEARIKALELQASWSPYIYPYVDPNTPNWPDTKPWESPWTVDPNYPCTAPNTNPPYTVWTSIGDTDFVASDTPNDVEHS